MTLILFSTLTLSQGPGIDLTVASGPPPFLTTPGPEIFAEVEKHNNRFIYHYYVKIETMMLAKGGQ